MREPPDRRLPALAAWQARFPAPDFTFGEWIQPTEGPDGVIQMGWYSLSPDAERFVAEMYESGWVHNFDWAKWARTARGERFLADPTAVADASADELRRLLTTIIRADRFSEGYLAGAYESGLLAAIARRAEVLLEVGE